jgi:hypothetical protein
MKCHNAVVNSITRRIVIETHQRCLDAMVGKTFWIESENAGAADVEAVERNYGKDGRRERKDDFRTIEKAYMFLLIAQIPVQANALYGPLRPSSAPRPRWCLAVQFLNIKVIQIEERYV